MLLTTIGALVVLMAPRYLVYTCTVVLYLVLVGLISLKRNTSRVIDGDNRARKQLL